MTEYVLLERKDLLGNTLYALPREQRKDTIGDGLNLAGYLSTEDEAYLEKVLTLSIIGSLAKPSDNSRLRIETALYAMTKYGVNAPALSKDEDVIKMMLGYTRIEGDLYWINEIPSDQSRRDDPSHRESYQHLTLLSPTEEPIRAVDNRLYQGKEQIAPAIWDQFFGTYEAKKVGKLTCHRRTLETESVSKRLEKLRERYVSDRDTGFGFSPRVIIKNEPFELPVMKEQEE